MTYKELIRKQLCKCRSDFKIAFTVFKQPAGFRPRNQMVEGCLYSRF